MNVDPRTPVIVGAAQVTVAEPYAPEPVELLATAARDAAQDSGAPRLLARLDSIRVVGIVSRRYPDPAALVARHIGADPRHRATTTDGGQHPQALVHRTAIQIARGELDIALIGGAEAVRTRSAYKRDGRSAGWSTQSADARPSEVYGSDTPFFGPDEIAAGLGTPVQMYPIFETALRAANGLSAETHRRRISELWSRFSQIAAGNPHAALRGGYSAEEVATVSPRNRAVCYPYPKLMNSNNAVDQAAALVMCSVEQARALGISSDRWVFPWSGAEANDTDELSHRHSLSGSPAIRLAGEVALRLAGVGVDELTWVDLYSCFPSAVQIAAAELGLPLDRQLTITGGLTFAGGPWNNYVTHAVATLVGLVRERPDGIGLITANGGLLTKHAIGTYSGRPPTNGFRHENGQQAVDALPTRRSAPDYSGAATVEGYTVESDPDGAAGDAVIAGLTSTGERTWLRTDDPDLVKLAVSGDLDRRRIDVSRG
jgi:acetyl-CoA C-acetyltransferase